MPPSEAAEAENAPAASSGGDERVLRVGISKMMDEFDPGYSIGIQTIKVFYNIYDRLLTTDKDGNVVGQLAKEWEWLDDTTLNVTLRDNVTFHNGEPCTAEDVKFTFDRTQTYGTGLISVLYDTLDSIEIVDDLTVQFKLKQPDSSFEKRLASLWGASIVPKDYIEEIGNEAFMKSPVGTGPFSMEYSPEKIVLTRYDGFWGEAPNVDRIELIPILETSARMTALINGEVDIVNDVTVDLVDTINSYDNLSVIGTPVKNIHTYLFNTKAGNIMSDQKFRQALCIGINRQMLVDSFWGEYAYVPNGHQFPSYGDLYIEDYPGLQYDVDYAKQLVEESGYNGEDIEIQMISGNYMNGNQAGEAVVSMWKEIGVTAHVAYVDKMDWDYDYVRTWSSADRFDNPLGCLGLLFGEGSEFAMYNWDMPEEFAAAQDTLRSSKDLEEQRAAARTMLEIFDTDCPATYLYMVEDQFGVRDGLNWDMSKCQSQVLAFRAEDFSFAD